MRPTLEYVKEKFLYFNKLCFNNELPMLPIRLNTRRNGLGLTRFRRSLTADGKIVNTDFSIEISVRSDLPEEEYIDTLVHEMIHYHIAYHNIVDTSIHGEVFQRIMNHIISTFGVKVSIEFDPDDEYLVNTISRPRFVCVAEYNDGSTGLSVVAKNKLFPIWEYMEKIDDVKIVRWYVSDRAIFQKFPVMVSPGMYIVDADKIHHYLTGAQELQNDGKTIKVKQDSV
ncbi:MAG: SprT-like domain-containing protein [Sodaliphilus sp.]